MIALPPLQRHRTADGLAMAWYDYPGAAERPPVLCVPGLTRSARDFAAIAAEIAPARRVISVELRGRGQSDHDPTYANYNFATELADVLSLMDAIGLEQVILLGTSRGGVIAMLMAAAAPDRLDSAILNDVGPEIDPRGLARIMSYVGRTGVPPDWAAAAAAVRAANEEFIAGESAAFWDRFARMTWRDVDGRPAPDYDPAIAAATAEQMAAQAEQAKQAAERGEPPQTLWPAFHALAQKPVLALRGANSDLLSAETLAAMKKAAPGMTAVEIPNRGHVPLLDEAHSIQAIAAFLETRP